MKLVLDASVTIAILLREDNSKDAERLFQHLNDFTTTVPAIWALEVSNGLVNAVRRGRINETELDVIVSGLVQLSVEQPPTSETQDVREIVKLARRHNLSTYDAAYLELAKRLGAELATLDRRLASAATAESVRLALMQRS